MKHHPRGPSQLCRANTGWPPVCSSVATWPRPRLAETGRAGRAAPPRPRGGQGSAPPRAGGARQHQHDGPGVAFGKAAQLPAQTAQLRLRCAREHGPGIQNAQTRPSGQACAAHFAGPGSPNFLGAARLVAWPGTASPATGPPHRLGATGRAATGHRPAGRRLASTSTGPAASRLCSTKGPHTSAAGFIGGQQHSGRARQAAPPPQRAGHPCPPTPAGAGWAATRQTLPPRAPVFSCRHSVCHLKNPNRPAPGAVGPPKARAPGRSASACTAGHRRGVVRRAVQRQLRPRGPDCG